MGSGNEPLSSTGFSGDEKVNALRFVGVIRRLGNEQGLDSVLGGFTGDRGILSWGLTFLSGDTESEST